MQRAQDTRGVDLTTDEGGSQPVSHADSCYLSRATCQAAQPPGGHNNCVG